MAASELDNPCNFDTLFSMNVPDILEHIYFLLDYESYKSCQDVSTKWRKLLTSRRYITKAKVAFRARISWDDEILVWAASTDRKDLVRRLLSNGMVDVDGNEDIYFDHGAPLHGAAFNGHKEMAQILLQNGANPNLVADGGRRTPLYAAVYENRLEVARLLIESGADANASDENGYTALHRAANNGHKEIVELLIENGADVNVSTQTRNIWGFNIGTTPLHKASEEGHIDVAKLLIDGGANPEVEDEHERTPLHYAVIGGYEDVIQLLIAHGATTDLEDEDGRTSRHLTTTRGYV